MNSFKLKDINLDNKIKELAKNDAEELLPIRTECYNLVNDIDQITKRIAKLMETAIINENHIYDNKEKYFEGDDQIVDLNKASDFTKKIVLIIDILDCLKKIESLLYDKEGMQIWKQVIERLEGFSRIIKKFFPGYFDNPIK